MRIRIAIVAALTASCALAHGGEPLEPHDLWKAWSTDPGVVIPLALSAMLSALYTRRAGFSLSRTAFFAAGWLTLVIALISPLHPLGEALFCAHMVQHELLMVVAAPLLVLSQPLIAFLWALPFEWRRTIGKWAKKPVIADAWRQLTDPLTAWIIHAAVLWGWHIPGPFQATLTSDLVHSAQHLSFLLSALLFWWALFRGAHGYGIGVLYIFTTAVHTSILGVLLTFSPRLWYPAYATRTAAWGLSPLEDQQIGGLVMWVPAGIVYAITGLALFAMWLRDSGTRAFEWTPKISAAILVCAVIASSGCNRSVADDAIILTGGNPARGKDKIQYYGCPSCHTIPGIYGADGLVGPSLARIASRVYVGGVLPNTPENMIRWIRNAKAVDQLTAMPNMNVTDSDARDIAGYLYTLR